MNSSSKILFRLPIETPHGTFVAGYSEKGLAQLDFPNGKDVAASIVAQPYREWHKVTTRALNDTLEGKASAQLPPLDLSAGTDFQRRVWAQLQKIKPGQTVGYAELACRFGQPKAARAVGGACGANPIPVLIPCHRVLAASKKIGGFSGGLEWKRKLLAIEGLSF